MDDYRVKVGFLDHPKTIMFKRRVGPGAVETLLRMFEFCTMNSGRTGGSLDGMSNEAIAIALRWDGYPDELVGWLCEVGFLDKNDAGDVVSVHDWAEHNGYVAGHLERSRRATRGGKASGKSRKKSSTKATKSNPGAETVEPKAASTPEAVEPKAESGQEILNTVSISIPVSNSIPNTEPIPESKPPAQSDKEYYLARAARGVSTKAPDAQSAPPSGLIEFKMPTTQYDHLITGKEIDGWSEAYPAVDVLQALRSMRQWCLSNPKKKKTARGVRRFITSWLEREQNKGGNQGNGAARPNKSHSKFKSATERAMEIAYAEDRANGIYSTDEQAAGQIPERGSG